MTVEGDKPIHREKDKRLQGEEIYLHNDGPYVNKLFCSTLCLVARVHDILYATGMSLSHKSSLSASASYPLSRTDCTLVIFFTEQSK